MKLIIPILILAGVLVGFSSLAQPKREDIHSDFVLFGKRQRLQKDLVENTIGKTFSQPITEDNQHKFESACWAITQFHINNELVDQGFRKMFAHYDSLAHDTRRALLEATYAITTSSYTKEIKQILEKETHPKLFAMCGLYLSRADSSIDMTNHIKIRMVERFPDNDSIDILVEFNKQLDNSARFFSAKIPLVKDLMKHHQLLGHKVIYSFQRWNRDYPGLAIVQYENGEIARRADGRIMVFEQLARSGSSLPYFITNGNTPQGIYRITGTAVANNKFIGPTPNLQLIMPFEDSLVKFFNGKWDSSIAPLTAYQNLLPASWKNYEPIRESFYAGKIGRTEIIAHGTTLDPEYFKDQPYYPLTPTLGCLCAKEIWNVTTGRLLVSEQYNLVTTFMSTPGSKGYLIVINLDDQPRAVTRSDIEKLLSID